MVDNTEQRRPTGPMSEREALQRRVAKLSDERVREVATWAGHPVTDEEVEMIRRRAATVDPREQHQIETDDYVFGNPMGKINDIAFELLTRYEEDRIWAVVIEPDGKAKRQTVPANHLHAVYENGEWVGGSTKTISIWRDEKEVALAWVNANARVFDLPVNPLAAAAIGKDNLNPEDWIAGAVVITGPLDERSGDEGPIPEALAVEILTASQKLTEPARGLPF